MAEQIKRGQTMGLFASGTNWVNGLIAENLQIEMVPTDHAEGKSNFGWKHGMLGSVSRVYEMDGVTFQENEIIPIDWDTSADTLFVVVYRNPFTFYRSLHRKPHHAHELHGVSFDQFVSSPYRHYSAAPYTEFDDDPDARLRWVRPQYLRSEFSYRSVRAMRAAGILITSQLLRNQAQNIAYLNYESVLEDPRYHLGRLAAYFGLAMNTEFNPVDTYKASGKEQFRPTEYAPIELPTLQFLVDSKNADWDLERSIGYPLAPDVSANELTDADCKRPAESLLKLTPLTEDSWQRAA